MLQRISRVSGWHSLQHGSARALTSQTGATTADFVKQRRVYKEQLSSMRKKWSEDIRLRKEAEERERAAEKEKIVLAKAIRLREKRKEAVVRQAADKASKVKAAQEYDAHLAKNIIVHDERKAVQSSYYSDFIEELEKESKYWITPANMDSVITEEFFEKPSTSGLLFRDSEHWRYAIHTLKIKRFQDTESSEMRGLSFAERMDRLQDLRSTRAIIARDFLEPMIGSGAERARFDEILKETSEVFQADDRMWKEIEDADNYHMDEMEYGDYDMDGGDGKLDPHYVSEYDEDDDDDDDDDENEV